MAMESGLMFTVGDCLRSVEEQAVNGAAATRRFKDTSESNVRRRKPSLVPPNRPSLKIGYASSDFVDARPLVPAMSLACRVGASVLRQGRRAGSLCAVHRVTLATAFACAALRLLGTIGYLERWLDPNSTGKTSASATRSRWVSGGWRLRRWWHSPKPSTRNRFMWM